MRSDPETGDPQETGGGAASAAADAERRRRKSVALARKIAVTIAGTIILAAGVAMLVLPGPGLLVIVLGLFVLSLEFEWAEKRLDQARDKALEAAHKTAASKAQTWFAVLSSLGLIALGLVLGLGDSLPLSGWITGGTLIVSGLAAIATVAWSVRDLRRRRS